MPKARKRKRISEGGLARKLANFFDNHYADKGGSACTFDERMLLTDNKGVVLTLPNGQEFQITIVDSTRYY